MKLTTFNYLFATISSLLILSSCADKAPELVIQDAEIDKLTVFVDEANAISQQYNELTGPKGSEIFGNNKAAVCGNEHDFIGPCIWAIDDIVEAIDFRGINEFNQWFIETGALLYDIRNKNKDFESHTEFNTEIACLIAPEIQTRSKDNDCYKSNLVALLNGALNGGISHSTNYYNNESLTKDQMYVVGSSFYKIWRYMVNMDKC